MQPTPYYLIVAFWGDRFREDFYALCLSSLLASGNIPALRDVPGSKFLIATSQNDWRQLQGRPLFERLRQYIEPVLIDIGYPEKGSLPLLHMSKGHRLAARRAVADRAWAGFFAPDLLVSDGAIAFAIDKARTGKMAVLTAALRYATEPVMDELSRLRLMEPDEPTRLESRVLGRLACKSLHSEIAEYEFEKPYYGDDPIWSYWRVPGREAMIVHTVSWALLLGNFGKIRNYSDGLLENDTIDGRYVDSNFFGNKDKDLVYLSPDSDEAVFMSLTPESERTYLPYLERPINRTAGSVHQHLVDICRFLNQPKLDDFRRWAYTVPVHIHGDELTPISVAMAKQSAALIDRALSIGIRERFLLGCYRVALRFGVADPEVYPRGLLDLWIVADAGRWRSGPLPRVLTLRAAWIAAYRRIEALLLRAAFGWVIGPLFGRADHETLVRLFRVVPRRYARSVLWRIRSSRSSEDPRGRRRRWA
jgi:hypothetical protein